MRFNDENVISGSHGEVWINDELFEEVFAFKAEVSLNFADVNKGKSMSKHQKLIGYECKGEFTMNKINSKIPKMIADALKKGKIVKLKVISNLDDPDAFGNERIAIYDAVPSSFPISEWQNRQLSEVKIPFTFTDYEYLESI